MKTVRYTGTSHIRSLVKGDFTDNGVDDQSAIKVAGPNHPNPRRDKLQTTVEVSDKAADWLIEAEEFELVKSPEEANQYDNLTLGQLQAEVDRRNDDRDDNLIARNGTKATLIERLLADDANAID